jgi:hypothetical protein
VSKTDEQRARKLWEGIGEKVVAGDGRTRYEWMRYADRDRFVQRIAAFAREVRAEERVAALEEARGLVWKVWNDRIDKDDYETTLDALQDAIRALGDSE